MTDRTNFTLEIFLCPLCNKIDGSILSPRKKHNLNSTSSHTKGVYVILCVCVSGLTDVVSGLTDVVSGLTDVVSGLTDVMWSQV